MGIASLRASSKDWSGPCTSYWTFPGSLGADWQIHTLEVGGPLWIFLTTVFPWSPRIIFFFFFWKITRISCRPSIKIFQASCSSFWGTACALDKQWNFASCLRCWDIFSNEVKHLALVLKCLNNTYLDPLRGGKFSLNLFLSVLSFRGVLSPGFLSISRWFLKAFSSHGSNRG